MDAQLMGVEVIKNGPVEKISHSCASGSTW